MNIPRCPRCGKHPICYTEMWTNHGIEFEANGGIPEPEGYLFDGVPDHVLARCECKHEWRLKRVRQITELRGAT